MLWVLLLLCVKYIFFWFHRSVGFEGNIECAKKGDYVSPRGGGHSLIWAIRGRAAGQGMVFWPRCLKQGVQFDLPLS